MTTAQLLRAYRAAHSLSQSQAAKRLGFSVRTLQGWEIGMGEPRGLYRQKLISQISEPQTVA